MGSVLEIVISVYSNDKSVGGANQNILWEKGGELTKIRRETAKIERISENREKFWKTVNKIFRGNRFTHFAPRTFSKQAWKSFSNYDLAKSQCTRASIWSDSKQFYVSDLSLSESHQADSILVHFSNFAKQNLRGQWWKHVLTRISIQTILAPKMHCLNYSTNCGNIVNTSGSHDA